MSIHVSIYPLYIYDEISKSTFNLKYYLFLISSNLLIAFLQITERTDVVIAKSSTPYSKIYKIIKSTFFLVTKIDSETSGVEPM